jgi:TRAP-type transport system small permease protein
MTELATPPKDSRPVRLLLAIGSVFVAAIVVLTFAQVVLRYFFNNPQAWAEEVSRYLFVWITFLGIAIGFAKDMHIRLDALTVLLPERPWRVVDVARRLVELAAVAIMLYSGALVAWQYRSTTFYTVQGLPRVIFYLAVPIGAAIALVYVVRGLLVRRSKAETTQMEIR